MEKSRGAARGQYSQRRSTFNVQRLSRRICERRKTPMEFGMLGRGQVSLERGFAQSRACFGGGLRVGTARDSYEQVDRYGTRYGTRADQVYCVTDGFDWPLTAGRT